MTSFRDIQMRLTRFQEFTFTNNISSETNGPNSNKFHLKHLYVREKQFRSGGSSLLTKMTDVSVFLKGRLKCSSLGTEKQFLHQPLT